MRAILFFTFVANLLFSILPPHIQALDIYIDAAISPSSAKNQFNSLQQALDYLNSKPSPLSPNEAVALYIKPNANPYTLDSTQQYIFSDLNASRFTMSIWRDSEQVLEGCKNLPTINAQQFNLNLLSLALVNITGLHLTHLGTQFQINHAKNIYIDRICLSESPENTNKYFFNIQNAESITIQNIHMNLTRSNGAFNSYTSNANVHVENITFDIPYSSPDEPRSFQDQYNMRFLNNKSSINTSPQTITLVDLTVGFVANETSITALVELEGWDQVSIQGIFLQGLSYEIGDDDYRPFKINDVTEVSIDSLALINNFVNLTTISEKASLFWLKNIRDIRLLNNFVINNQIDTSVSLLSTFRVFEVRDFKRISFESFKMQFNEFVISTSILSLKTDYADEAVEIDVQDVQITDNLSLETQILHLIQFSKGAISDFRLNNLRLAHNQISGRLFHFETIGNANMTCPHLSCIEVDYKTLNFTNILVKDNMALRSFAIIYFSVINPSTVPSDYVPISEYYSLVLENMTLFNNGFLKGQNADWLDQDGFIQITGAQTYIKDSNISKNWFHTYDFLSLNHEISSVIFLNNTVDDLYIEHGNFIITRYEALKVTRGPYYDTSENYLSPLYRQAIIMDSNFTNLAITEGAMFIFHNGYLMIMNNVFEHVCLNYSQLLSGGQFTPPQLELKYYFGRNISMEMQVFSINSYIYEIFNRTMQNMLELQRNTVYFYVIQANKMSDFEFAGDCLMHFTAYEFEQSIFSLEDNNISNFKLYNESSRIVGLIGSFNAFTFHNNSINNVSGPGTVLQSVLLENNKMFLIVNNSMENCSGPSFLSASGGRISHLEVSNNEIKNIIFPRNLINIDMLTHKGKIRMVNNTLINNTLLASPDDLHSKLSFIAMTIEANIAWDVIYFDEWKLSENTFNNTKSFSQYGQMNALFSLLLGNSTVYFRNSTFERTIFNSNGNSMFYVTAYYVQLTNCSFDGAFIVSGTSVFNLLSTMVHFFDSTFINMRTPNGRGPILINPYPYLTQTILALFSNNTFKDCKAGHHRSLMTANVLMVDSADITLDILQNKFIDSYDTNPVFFIKNSSCMPFTSENNHFEVSSEGVDENNFYKVHESQGTYYIRDSQVSYLKDDDTIDVFFTAVRSPRAEITIDNFTWAENSIKGPIQVAKIDSGRLTIQNTILDGFTYPTTSVAGYAIQVDSASINFKLSELNLYNFTVKNTKFTRSLATEKIKAGVIAFLSSSQMMSYYWKLHVINCAFDTLETISAIYLQMPTIYNIKILNSTFNNIKSIYGSAFNFFPSSGLQFQIANAHSQIILANNTFSNNQATKVGGAIYMSTANYSLINNKFINNSAQYLAGGVLLHSSIKSQDIYNLNFFESNKASNQPDVGSILSDINVTFILPSPSKPRYIDPTAFNNSFNDPFVMRNLNDVSLSVTFLGRDRQPTLDFVNTSRYLHVVVNNHPPMTSFNCTMRGCYIDRLNITLAGLEGDKIQVQIFYYSALLTSGQLRVQRTFYFQLTPCVSGESFNPQTRTCDYCQAGRYSLRETDACQDCPNSATCPGGNILIPKEDYWLKTTTVAEFYECRKDGIKRCAGGLKNGGCKLGYSGPLCQACDFDNGYVESGLLRCKKCQDQEISLLLNVGTILGFILYKMLCIGSMYSTNKKFHTESSNLKETFRFSEQGYYLKLLLVYTQILSLVYLFNMEVREFLGSLIQIGNPSEFILLNLQCSMLAVGLDPQSFIFISVVILLVSPLLECLFIIILTKLILKRFFQGIDFKQYMRLTIVYLILLEQPGIVGYLNAFLSCSNIYKGSETLYITSHPNWSCDDPQYIFYQNYVALPLLVFWALVIPVIMFLSLFRKRRALDEPDVRLTYGVLYNINKAQYYYWGTIVMILNLVISCTAYLFQDDLKVCVFTLFILLWSYQFAVRQLKPYRFAKFNSMESITFSLLMLDIILGYYVIDNNHKPLKITAYLLLIMLNLAMFGFLAWKIFHTSIKNHLKSFIDWLKNKFGTGKSARKKKPENELRIVLIKAPEDETTETLTLYDSTSNKTVLDDHDDSPFLRTRKPRKSFYDLLQPEEDYVL